MLNSDADKNNFESWLSAGLKVPVTTDNKFAEQLLARLAEEQNAKLLQQVRTQQKIYTGLLIGLVLSCIGALCYPPLSAAIYSFLQTVFTHLIELILEPTLTGIIIPVSVVIAAVAVLWNLIEMVSLE